MENFCKLHNKPLKQRPFGVWDHRAKLDINEKYDPNGFWYWCQGNGWHISSTQEMDYRPSKKDIEELAVENNKYDL